MNSRMTPRFLNLDILDEARTIGPADILSHLAKHSAEYICLLLHDSYPEQSDEFSMARNALLPIPDIQRKWLGMPQVRSKAELPESVWRRRVR